MRAWLLCLLFVSVVATDAAAESLLIERGTLWDGTGAAPVANANVLLKDGRIVCAGPATECRPPRGATRIDARGKWIVPGLIDSHVHFSQTGFIDGRPDGLGWQSPDVYAATQAMLRREQRRYQQAYVCNGITAVFDVGGYPWTWDARNNAETSPMSPRIAATGPLLSTVDHWLNVPAERQFLKVDDAAMADQHVAYLKANQADAVKLWFVDDGSVPFENLVARANEIGNAAERSGLRLFAHAVNLAEAKAVLRAGAHVLVHSVEDQLIDEELLQLLKEKDALYIPTLLAVEGYVRTWDATARRAAPELVDPLECVDAYTRRLIAEYPQMIEREELPALPAEWVASMRADDEKKTQTRAENLRRIADAGVRIAVGTDAGNSLTLHGSAIWPELRAMKTSGMTPEQILVSATRNGAAVLGRTDELGTLEAGKRGDILVVNADPLLDIENLQDIDWVVRGGVAHRQSELRTGNN